jgi:hypothetical protein
MVHQFREQTPEYGIDTNTITGRQKARNATGSESSDADSFLGFIGTSTGASSLQDIAISITHCCDMLRPEV